jgi:hypothetical protein
VPRRDSSQADHAEEKSTPLKSAELRLSVIVAVHNRGEALASCLEALAASDLPRQLWELVVICPEHGDEELLISARHANAIIRLPKGAWGASYGRNRGAEMARAPLLAFVNPDVCVAPNALGRMVRLLDTNTDISAVCGMLLSDGTRSHLLSDYRALRDEFRSWFTVGRTDSFAPEFAAVRADAFADAGMFDEWRIDVPRIEGAEFGLRMIGLGHGIVLHSEIRAFQKRRWRLGEIMVTGIRDHGVPWEGRTRSSGIAVSSGLRTLRMMEAASVPLTWCTLVFVAVSLKRGGLGFWIAAEICAVFAAMLSAPMLVFFARRRSVLFAAMTAPLYVFESLLDGIGAAYSSIVRHTIGEPRPTAVIDALAEVGMETWPPIPTRRPVRASIQASS